MSPGFPIGTLCAWCAETTLTDKLDGLTTPQDHALRQIYRWTLPLKHGASCLQILSIMYILRGRTEMSPWDILFADSVHGFDVIGEADMGYTALWETRDESAYVDAMRILLTRRLFECP